jgi:SAM-dependent methyltransferase
MGVLGLAAERLASVINGLKPSVRVEIRNRGKRAEAFDQQFGVDTSGCIHQTELTVNNPNQLHAVSYGGSDPKYFRDAISTLPIDYRQFTFIDFGSGKGRAILLATEYPFRWIVGVEFSEELDTIAKANIRHFRSNKHRCEHVESICLDATAYPLPNDNLVCYFCNPFDETVMRRVIDKIRDSLEQNPREVFIVYYNPKEGHLIDQCEFFSIVGTIGPVRIWRTAKKN